jgi:hypothetical protein
MSLFTALLAAHVILSVPSCNQVVVKTIEGAVCASLDFDNEINSKIIFEKGCKYIVTDCKITASAAGEMEHKAGSTFVMRGSTTFTLNGTARVAGEIGIEGGEYLNKNLLLISETGVFRVHQNGKATNSKTGSFYIAGHFVNENLFTNLGADSDGDNSGVPFGVSNDGTMTNHKNITNLGTMKNKGTILNKQGGVIDNEKPTAGGPPSADSCKEHHSSLIAAGVNPVSGVYSLNDGEGGTYSSFCDMETDGGGWTLVARVNEPYAWICPDIDVQPSIYNNPTRTNCALSTTALPEHSNLFHSVHERDTLDLVDGGIATPEERRETGVVLNNIFLRRLHSASSELRLAFWRGKNYMADNGGSVNSASNDVVFEFGDTLPEKLFKNGDNAKMWQKTSNPTVTSNEYHLRIIKNDDTMSMSILCWEAFDLQTGGNGRVYESGLHAGKGNCHLDNDNNEVQWKSHYSYGWPGPGVHWYGGHHSLLWASPIQVVHHRQAIFVR